MNFSATELLELDPSLLGEVLMAQLNKNDRWGYSTRESEHLVELEGYVPSLYIRTLCCGCEAKIEDCYSRIQTFQFNDIKVYLYWDGDGTVVFEHRDWTVVNSDIKFDWDWTTGEWALEVLESETYYEGTN